MSTLKDYRIALNVFNGLAEANSAMTRTVAGLAIANIGCKELESENKPDGDLEKMLDLAEKLSYDIDDMLARLEKSLDFNSRSFVNMVQGRPNLKIVEDSQCLGK